MSFSTNSSEWESASSRQRSAVRAERRWGCGSERSHGSSGSSPRPPTGLGAAARSPHTPQPQPSLLPALRVTEVSHGAAWGRIHLRVLPGPGNGVSKARAILQEPDAPRMLPPGTPCAHPPQAGCKPLLGSQEPRAESRCWSQAAESNSLLAQLFRGTALGGLTIFADASNGTNPPPTARPASRRAESRGQRNNNCSQHPQELTATCADGCGTTTCTGTSRVPYTAHRILGSPGLCLSTTPSLTLYDFPHCKESREKRGQFSPFPSWR